MNNCYLEFPETAGKIIEHIRYIHDPSGMPEVDIWFTDGVSLSIKLEMGLKANSTARTMETSKRLSSIR